MSVDLSTLNVTPKGSLPPLIGIYGTDGVGKTGLALQADDVAYAPTEQRFGHYEAMNLFQTPENPNAICQSFGQMNGALTALLEQDHNFQTLVVDSLDHFEPMIWDAVCQKYDKSGEFVHEATPESKKATTVEDYGYGKGYIYADNGWQYFYSLLNRLRNEKNMTVITVSHYTLKEEKSAEGESFEQYQIKLHRRAAALTREVHDAILFAKFKNHIQKVGEGLRQRNIPVGTDERVLVCQPRPSCVVKTSFDTMPKEMPLSWADVKTHIPYFQNQQPNS